MKLNHQNFQDAPRGSAILIDLNEDMNRQNFEDVSSESAIFEDCFRIKRCSKAQQNLAVSCESAILDISESPKKRFFEDVSSESAIFRKSGGRPIRFDPLLARLL